MSVLTPNTLFRERSTGRRLRFLALVAPEGCDGVDEMLAVTFDCDDKRAVPTFRSPLGLREDIFSRLLVRVHESSAIVLPEQMSPADKRLTDQRWEAWKRLGGMSPRMLAPHTRGPALRAASADGLGSIPYLMKVLRLGWRHGGTYDGFATSLPACGAPGNPRISLPGAVKTGRPRSVLPGVGMNLTQKDRDNIDRFLAASTLTRRWRRLGSLWSELLNAHYAEHLTCVDARGRPSYDPDKVPSQYQFMSYALRQRSVSARALSRLGARKFELAFKLLLTGTLHRVRGPGTRFYIDSTTLDVYVVSRLSRRPIGRPTLYLVVDDFSRLIVGVYIGLEPPCWQGAMLALWNCAMDKVAFCSRYGVVIDARDWPTAGMPAHLMGDRGELKAHEAERLSQGFHYDVENAPPYRGEAKGVGERAFGVVQSPWGDYIPGYVDKELLERGNLPPHHSAGLDLEQVTEIVIRQILMTNNRVMHRYEGWPDVVADGTPFIPSELWHWGVENLVCEARQFERDHMVKYLLPSKRVRVDRRGLQFVRGLYYMGEDISTAEWHHEMLARTGSLVAYYHPTQLESVHIVAPEGRGKLITANATPRCARLFSHGQLTTSDLSAHDWLARRRNAEAEYSMAPLVGQLQHDNRTLARDASRHTKWLADPTMSRREISQGMRDRRNAELDDLTAEALAVEGTALSKLQTPPLTQAPAAASSAARTRDRVKALIDARRASS